MTITTYSISNDEGQTLTFNNAWIKSYSSAIAMNEKDTNVMPTTGPMANQTYDYNGVTKIITMSGEIFDVTGSVVTGGTHPEGFDNVLAIKYWLEALLSGQQQAKNFVSPQDSKSLELGGGISTTAVFAANDLPGQNDALYLPGTWIQTKVFVISVEFPDAEENVGVKLPFTLTLEVSI